MQIDRFGITQLMQVLARTTRDRLCQRLFLMP